MAIQANEIRIGNYVNDVCFGSISKFDSFKDLCDVELNPEEFEPIPLTEEWLLKFGFAFQDDSFSIRNLFIVFFEGKIECYFKDWAVGHLVKLRNLQYVHQLQNLNFALTGYELTIP